MGKGSKEIFFPQRRNEMSHRYIKRCSTFSFQQGNANQTNMTYHLMPATMAIIKKKQEISVGKVVEKGKLCALLVGILIGEVTMD